MGFRWGFCEANRVGGLGGEERERGLGEEQRDKGFDGEQRERGLGEEEKELCFGEGEREKSFGEVEGGKCLGELEKEMGLGEDLEGRGEVSLWDCAKGLLLEANPVAWMTLMCWPSSSAVLELWRNSAADRPAG